MSTTRIGIQACIVAASLIMLRPLTAQPAASPAQTTAERPEVDLASPLAARRVRAVNALAELSEISGPQWVSLQRALNDEEPRIRERVLQIYAAHPEAASKATRQLFPLMADQDQGERGPVWLAAGEAIAAIGPSVIPELIRRLEPANDITVYRSACAALAKFGPASEPALPRLIVLLSDDGFPVGPVLFVLQEMGPKAAPAVPPLIQRLDDQNFHHQYWTCRVLGAIGKQAEPSIPKLLDLLKNGVTSVRRNAAMSLGNIGIGSDKVVNGLDAALLDPIVPVRHEALIGLGKLGPKSVRSLGKIMAIANNTQASSQSDAAWAWWQIADKPDGAVDVLLRELKRPDAPWDASRYLAEIAVAANAIERIVLVLDEPLAETRVFAIETLALIGPPASSAEEALKQLQNDPEVGVREAARKALTAIQGHDK
jgi:HEAT repeat protein